MIIDNNISNWDGVKEVVIFHTSELDSIFATRITYENIRKKYNIENVTLRDITTEYPVAPVTMNPREDLIVVFIGVIPNMMFVDKTIEMIGAEHVLLLINNPTYIDYFYKYSFTNEMMGLLVREFSLYELAYLYWFEGARFCDADCHYCIIVRNSMTLPVNGKAGNDWNIYYKSLQSKGYLEINEAFNEAIYAAEVKPGCADDLNLYFGMLTVVPSITEDAEFWQELYADPTEVKECTNISIYTTLGKSCRHMLLKDNIRDFRTFAFLGKIRKYEEFSAVVINQPFAGVWTFCREEIFNKYHIGVEFCFNGRMHYRIHRLGKDPNLYVPIRKIAESYGGAGNDYVGTFHTNGSLEILPTNKI